MVNNCEGWGNNEDETRSNGGGRYDKGESWENKDDDSSNASYALLAHVRERGIPTQEPVLNKDGQLYSLETFTNCDKEGSSKQCGPYLGFSHRFFENYEFLWSLTETTRLREFYSAVKNDNDLEIVKSVVDAFERDIVPRYTGFTPGVIHGDLNEQNIIVSEVPGQRKVTCDQRVHDVIAILDWAHVTKSYFVFDIAINIAYLSIECEENKQLDVGGHILKGYANYRKINDVEFQSIPLLVCCRLCQSLVYGAHAYSQQPGNEYLISTAKKGWPLLRKYWNADFTNLLNKWKSMIESD
ncbi:hydroxylysine kinase-like [Mya arenaria]|uniref:hydroxylysine kinase-like n=1 Tax=Mya arenaria TaxID=6604 RepID=UPI0022E4AEBF|nr:hydroxylysine kinase-like [Mya arenaria]